MPRPCCSLALAGVALVAAPSLAGARTVAPSVPATAAVSASPKSTGPELAERASGLADEATARWALLQRPDGRFPDPLAGAGEDYGTAMLGLAMVRRGAARSDRALVRGGLAAILAEVERPTNGAFEPLVLAEAYRFGNAELSRTPGVADLWSDAEPRLRADLVRRPPAGEGVVASRCLADPACWNNLKLVGALAGAVLQRTGLASQVPGALLADPALASEIEATVGETVPEQVGSSVQRSGSSALPGGGILSDPPRDPLAYHALSTALLGRLVDELGPAAPPAAQQALNRASRALLLLAAPDGDLGWWGRGQGQVWVAAVAAEAAARAAVRAPAGGALRGRYLALAGAELAHLRDGYGVGAWGLPLVPGASDASTLRARGIDSYATTRGYNGLAVDALDRTAVLLRGVSGHATTVPATRAGAVRSPREAGLATITRAGTWVAIAGHPRARQDARYGGGLLAMQVRDAGGTWAGRLPQRPHSGANVSTLSIRQGGALLPAYANVTTARTSDAVVLRGGWAEPGGTRLVDQRTQWRWSLTPTGAVSVAVRMRQRRTVVATALAGDGDYVRRTPTGVRVVHPDGTRVIYTLLVDGRAVPIARSRRDIGASAYDAHVRALDLAVQAQRGASVSLRIVAAGAPPVAGG